MAKNEKIIKFAVISDLHVYDKSIEVYNNNPPSYFPIYTQDKLAHGESPGYDLYALIKEERLSVDYILCAGDIGHQGNPNHVKYSWEYLNTIKERLKAKNIYACTGNHDIDSRYKYNSYDAKGFLLTLSPDYPLDDINKKNEYWANNYLFIEEGDFNLILLNSSAFHGVSGEYDGEKFDEYDHGRISDYTMKSISSKLSCIRKKDINLLLCHHHPKKHDNIRVDDYSEMKGGSELLNMLSGGDYGSWLVIHGHRHFPIISYADGGSQSPTIFSAGSFSANLYPEIQTQAKNQFYILEFNLDDTETYGLVGNFKSWTWVKGKGWYQPDDLLGIPSHGGFGIRPNLKTTINKIFDRLKNTNAYIEWEELLSFYPEIKYYIPRDIENIAKGLKNKNVTYLQTSKSILTQIYLNHDSQ